MEFLASASLGIFPNGLYIRVLKGSKSHSDGFDEKPLTKRFFKMVSARLREPTRAIEIPRN